MMNLVKYEQDGLELYVDESTGLAYAHMKAIARMLGMNPTNGTLRRRLEIVPNDIVKTAEIQTIQGSRMVSTYPASVVFKLAMEFSPELAEAMGAAGANVYLLGQAGYEVKVAQPIPAPVNSPPRQLLSTGDAIEYGERIAKLADPILRSLLSQALYEDLGSRALPQAGTRNVPIAVLAREMGYKLKPLQDSALGKWASGRLQSMGKVPHGRYEVNVYEDCAETREAVRAFFNR